MAGHRMTYDCFTFYLRRNTDLLDFEQSPIAPEFCSVFEAILWLLKFKVSKPGIKQHGNLAMYFINAKFDFPSSLKAIR